MLIRENATRNFVSNVVQSERLNGLKSPLKFSKRTQGSSKQDHSVSKGTYGEYRTLREHKEHALSQELQMMSDSQNYHEQIHKLKAAFNKRFDLFVAKRTKAVRLRALRLPWAVLKAYTKKKRSDKHDEKMAGYCKK